MLLSPVSQSTNNGLAIRFFWKPIVVNEREPLAAAISVGLLCAPNEREPLEAPISVGLLCTVAGLQTYHPTITVVVNFLAAATQFLENVSEPESALGLNAH